MSLFTQAVAFRLVGHKAGREEMEGAASREEGADDCLGVGNFANPHGVRPMLSGGLECLLEPCAVYEELSPCSTLGFDHQ
jgi:hypothetical protein